MSLTKALIGEIQHESESTKKMIERVPSEKFDWQPHPKSMKMKNLATHIVGLADWPELIVKSDELDLAGGNLKVPDVNSTEDLVKVLNEKIQKSIEALGETQDEELKKEWVLRAGDHVIAKLPKSVAIRSIALNHLYHHRAQLSVYLRLLDVSVPGMYGPSADDKA